MGRSRENYQEVEDISSHKELSNQERYQFERRYPTQALETQNMDFSSVFGILLTICVLHTTYGKSLPGSIKCEGRKEIEEEHERKLNGKYLFVLRPGKKIEEDSSALAVQQSNDTFTGSSPCPKKQVSVKPMKGRIPEAFSLIQLQCQGKTCKGYYTSSILYLKKVKSVSETNPKEEWQLLIANVNE